MNNTGDYCPVKGYCNEKGISCEYANIRGYCGLTACLKHNSVQLNPISDFSLNFSRSEKSKMFIKFEPKEFNMEKNFDDTVNLNFTLPIVSQDSNEETGTLKVKIPRAKYEFEEGGIKISVLKSE
jgi:hypothetical protein|nr:MAG TPA: hypothetical protein [Bacteriophage sp.]